MLHIMTYTAFDMTACEAFKSGPRHAADQYDADTLTKDELTALLRGPAGSSVEMWVGGALAKGLPRKVELERRSLPQPPVKQVSHIFLILLFASCAGPTFVTLTNLKRLNVDSHCVHGPYLLPLTRARLVEHVSNAFASGTAFVI